MNPNTDEQQLARWLDGEMTETERTGFEARMTTDAMLREEAEGLRGLREMLRAAIPQQSEVPHADFFNSQIQQRIAEMHPDESKSASPRGSIWQWIRLPWLAAAAACIAAVLGFALWSPSQLQTMVLSTYAPNPGVQAKTFHSNDANATVLMLDGLTAIPASQPVVGYRVHHSETDQEVAMTTLFADDGQVLLVLAKDARNHLRLITH